MPPVPAPLDLDALDSLLAKAIASHGGKLDLWTDFYFIDDGYSQPMADYMVGMLNAAPALVSELRAAREALMCCALPLEVLAATECDVAGKALAPETKAAVMNAVKAIRLTLSRAATGGA